MFLLMKKKLEKFSRKKKVLLVFMPEKKTQKDDHGKKRKKEKEKQRKQITKKCFSHVPLRASVEATCTCTPLNKANLWCCNLKMNSQFCCSHHEGVQDVVPVSNPAHRKSTEGPVMLLEDSGSNLHIVFVIWWMKFVVCCRSLGEPVR